MGIRGWDLGVGGQGSGSGVGNKINRANEILFCVKIKVQNYNKNFLLFSCGF